MKAIFKKIKLYFLYTLFCIRSLTFKKKRVYLFHIPINSNMGDQAITYCEELFCKKYLSEYKYIEVSYYLEDRVFDKIKKRVRDEDVILIQGGGSMGDLYPKEDERDRNIIQSFPNNKILFFPQTITYRGGKESDDIKEKVKNVYKNHKNLTICAREKQSYEMMKELFPNNQVLLLPEIVLTLNYEKNYQRKDQVLFLLRHDFEKQLANEEIEKLQSYFTEKGISYENYDTFLDPYFKIKRTYHFSRKRRIKRLLKKIAKSKLVITDRLHGMVFSAITKTPCFVFENINHKIRGVYGWIDDLPYVKLVKESDEIISLYEEVLKSPRDYSNDKFQKEYESFLSIIKK